MAIRFTKGVETVLSVPEQPDGEDLGIRDRSVLEEAQELIHGDRNTDYGHPLDNHSATAELVRAYLRRKYGTAEFDADDVCVFNVLQKISRLANTPDHRDSLVDIAGYVGNVEMIHTERERRERRDEYVERLLTQMQVDP